jgi:hypothetical protein
MEFMYLVLVSELAITFVYAVVVVLESTMRTNNVLTFVAFNWIHNDVSADLTTNLKLLLIFEVDAISVEISLN